MTYSPFNATKTIGFDEPLFEKEKEEKYAKKPEP